MTTHAWSRGSSDVSMFDVWHHMDYIRRHYNATVEVLLDAGGDVDTMPMLYLTCIAHCGHRDHPRLVAGQCWKVTDDVLHRMPTLLLDALYQIHEQLDGACDACVRRVTDTRTN